jgi:chromate transport protein ChrA
LLGWIISGVLFATVSMAIKVAVGAEFEFSPLPIILCGLVAWLIGWLSERRQSRHDRLQQQLAIDSARADAARVVGASHPER